MDSRTDTFGIRVLTGPLGVWLISEFRDISRLSPAGWKVSTELSDFLGKHYTEWAEQVRICRKCGSKWREHMAWPTKGNDNDNDKDNESENVQKMCLSGFPTHCNSNCYLKYVFQTLTKNVCTENVCTKSNEYEHQIFCDQKLWYKLGNVY